jgi:3-hydroxybenzoate 6-monooxygenase
MRLPITSRPDVIVVGGGIGGLSAAFALTRQGRRVRVLERSAEFGEVGAGIQLAPNCTRILAEYGLLGAATRLGVLPGAMVMRDALDGTELTRLDLRDLEKRYGSPYLVIHRGDLHALFLRACQDAGVDLRTDAHVTAYENTRDGARVTLAADGGGAAGSTHEAPLVIAADGLHSVARKLLIDDQPVNSAYVAYRGTIPIATARDNGAALDSVVVYIGPRCHFVQYPLRGGELFNQVAVFESGKARSLREGEGDGDWGTPDELDAAFAPACQAVRAGLPHMWRDRWWRMFDRDPISTWVHGNIALLGDAAHPPLQYIAQGAIMAIEDGYVLARHAASSQTTAQALRAYEQVRAEHCRRVLTTSRAWGQLWHLDGDQRLRRNAILRARDPRDYSFVDWLYGPTALTPDQEAPMFQPVPLDAAPARPLSTQRTVTAG